MEQTAGEMVMNLGEKTTATTPRGGKNHQAGGAGGKSEKQSADAILDTSLTSQAYRLPNISPRTIAHEDIISFGGVKKAYRKQRYVELLILGAACARFFSIFSLSGKKEKSRCSEGRVEL